MMRDRFEGEKRSRNARVEMGRKTKSRPEGHVLDTGSRDTAGRKKEGQDQIYSKSVCNLFL